MPHHAVTSAHVLQTTVHHRIRTITVRDDMLGYIHAGSKQLLRPDEDMRFRMGEFFLIARNTQWDMVNEVHPQGQYLAHAFLFTPDVVELFHTRFPQFDGVNGLHGLQSCSRLVADAAFRAVFDRVFSSVRNAEVSHELNQHRLLELLLMLAERGIVFARPSALSWSDRVRRVVSQRPHALWTIDELANHFHTSASTLRRRLDSEGSTFRDCIREIRLETGLLLLETTMLPISDIAYRSGYASHSRFSAAFRERFGFSPSHLRPDLRSAVQSEA